MELGSSSAAERLFQEGLALQKAERYADALQRFERCLQLDDVHALCWAYKGAAIGSVDPHSPDALKAAERAVALDPNLAFAWVAKGFALSMVGRYQEALAASEKGLHIDKEVEDGWLIRGYVLNRLKRYEESVKALDEALFREPTSQHAIAWRKASINQKQLTDFAWDVAKGAAVAGVIGALLGWPKQSSLLRQMVRSLEK